VVPEAVVEIVSPGSERKDLEVGPPFYLSQGVVDVVVVDPRTSVVLHYRKSGLSRHLSPVNLTLDCGCTLKA
jgi:Uma2 family endonuclease